MDLTKSCLLCIRRVYFLELYLKTFIRIFLYDYDFIFIRILFIYLFNLLIYFTYLSDIYRNIFIKNLSGYISENVLYIMIYKYDSFEFKLYSLQKGTK